MQANLIKHLMTRRGALTGAGAVAAASMALGAPKVRSAEATTTQRQESSINFEDPAQNLTSFVRMAGDIDPNKETVGWFGGTIFSVIGDEKLKPLVDIEGIGVMRVAPQANGNYRMFNRELAFYKDPQTKDFIDVWRNPITREECEVSPTHNAVVNAEVAPIIKQDFDGTIVEIPFNPPWQILEDSVLSTFEIHTAFPNPLDPDIWKKESTGPISRISEVFQRSIPLTQLNDQSLTSVDYVGTWTRISPWLPWMLMGQREGHVLYRTFTKKLSGIDSLPRPLRALTEERFPEYLKAPGDETWGQPNDSSFTTYMSEREPVE